MKYNHYFANQFGSCRLLKTGRDPHRNRDVRIYALPGEFEVVGMTDGVDSWIAPVATGFLEDVRKLLNRIRSGEDVRAIAEAAAPARRRIALPGDEPERTPTGRLRRRIEPEIQNLPGTPSARLEMAAAGIRRRITP